MATHLRLTVGSEGRWSRRACRYVLSVVCRWCARVAAAAMAARAVSRYSSVCTGAFLKAYLQVLKVGCGRAAADTIYRWSIGAGGCMDVKSTSRTCWFVRSCPFAGFVVFLHLYLRRLLQERLRLILIARAQHQTAAAQDQVAVVVLYP